MLALIDYGHFANVTIQPYGAFVEGIKKTHMCKWAAFVLSARSNTKLHKRLQNTPGRYSSTDIFESGPIFSFYCAP